MRKIFFFSFILVVVVLSYPYKDEGRVSAALKVKEKSLKTGVQVVQDFGKIPLYFIENKGQVNKKALYYAKTRSYTLWITKEGLVFDSVKKAGEKNLALNKGRGRKRLQEEKGKDVKFKREVQRLRIIGANPKSKVKGEGKSNYTVNYFIGNDPSRWKTKIPTYFAVHYKDVYPGVDLKVYGKESQIEYDWIIKPGGDPSRIEFAYERVKTHIDDEGNIVVEGEFGKLLHRRPIARQGGKEVEAKFKKFGQVRYGLKVGDYDKTKELIVDPVVLVYSTYLGGNDYDEGRGIAIDSSGNAYVTGSTYSTDFPTKNPFQAYKAGYDVFVTKLSSSGNALVYSTYLGGSDYDYGRGIAVDSSNNTYITGYTDSGDFPTKNPFQAYNAGHWDAFVTKLSSSGNALVYSTYLGGSDYDYGRSIAVDSSGNAYVTGSTYSTDFPTKNPFQAYKAGAGEYDVFVTKFSSSGNTLVYSTYLGGNGDEYGYAIAIDSSGNAYVTGGTGSTDFPTKNPFQASHAGGDYDAFVTKLSSSGNALVYSTYLGGSDYDYGRGIAVDSSNNTYITGYTDSGDFPTKNPFQAYYALYDDAFVTKLSSSGNVLVYSTYLGGGSEDRGYDIVVDSSNNAYITGYTQSTDFPTKNSFQAYNAGHWDAFVTKLSSSGSALYYSIYLGGSYYDEGLGIAIDSFGNAYITGATGSTDFPTKNPFQAYNAGYWDAFITKLVYYKDTRGLYNPGTGKFLPK